MNMPEPISIPTTFAERLRSAGVEPGDNADLRLSKALLMLATGLVVAAMMIWVLIYNLLGLEFSATLPLAFQLLLAGNMLLFIATRNFDLFRISQLGMLLFLPFVAQWASGNVITSSGVVLWGILGPIGAILCFGARQSIGWFIAWAVLTALSGAVDYYLADPLLVQRSLVSTRISLVFFTLNILAVAGISYALLRFSIEQKLRIQEQLAQSRKQVMQARDAADQLFIRPII